MIGPHYPGRFALFDRQSSDTLQIPAEWLRRDSDGLCLATDPRLPVLEIRLKQGQRIGWLLGYPIDPTAQTLLTEAFQLPLESEALDAQSFERELHALGGRFAAIIQTKNFSRYYPDAAASLAAFVDLENRAIASTPAQWRKVTAIDACLEESLKRATECSGTLYPLGFSGYRNVRVVLPNHHVDLQTWTVHRHWPQAELLMVSSNDAKNVVANIFDDVRGTISAVATQHPITMDLTGGHDSRMLLSAALRYSSEIEFRTNLEHSPSDTAIAEGLSRIFNLHHNTPGVDPSARVLLRGYGGEVGRCFYWQKCPGHDSAPMPEQLLQAFGFPEPHNDMVVESGRWLASLPKLNRTAILDLAYIEQRLGTTMSHVLYNSDSKHRFSLFPLNHRRIYERMLSLPIEFRSQQRLATEMFQRGSPLLNLFPVNSPHFIGGTKYRKYFGYLRNRRTLNRQQQAIVRNYCTRGRSLLQMLADDLGRGPHNAIRRLRSKQPASMAAKVPAKRNPKALTP